MTAEVRHNGTNTVVCRVQGEWNGVLEFSYTSGETKVVDVTKLPVTKKRVRPIEKQGPTESRSGAVAGFHFEMFWGMNSTPECVVFFLLRN